MLVNRSVRKFVALVLAGAAVAGVIEVRSGAVGARAVAASARNQGDPRAVPPILPPASPSELAAIRRQEVREAAAFSYRVPLTARYSDAEMDALCIRLGARVLKPRGCTRPTVMGWRPAAVPLAAGRVGGRVANRGR